jgi:hypothetical protein
MRIGPVLENNSGACVCSLLCFAGTYSEGSATACTPCIVGYMTPGTGTAGSDDTACTLCAAGYYGASFGGTYGCSTCPRSTYSPTAGNGITCIICDRYATGCDGTSKGTCQAGYTLQSGFCRLPSAEPAEGTPWQTILPVAVAGLTICYFCFEIYWANCSSEARAESAAALGVTEEKARRRRRDELARQEREQEVETSRAAVRETHTTKEERREMERLARAEEALPPHAIIRLLSLLQRQCT